MFSAKNLKQDFSNNSSNNNKNDYLKQFHAHVTLSIKQKHVMLFIPNKTLKMLVGFLAQKSKKKKKTTLAKHVSPKHYGPILPHF